MRLKKKLKNKERWFIWLTYGRIVSEITIVIGFAIILYYLFVKFVG
ncbi:MAG: hypothetical protein ACTSYA_01540 [Candidatus Kariarchaeaceae archaeon]